MTIARESLAENADPAAAARTGVASWYTPGLSDGLGDRLLMFDNSAAVPLELLRFPRAFSQSAAFELALRRRIDDLTTFSHPSAGTIRSIQWLGIDDGLALVSNQVLVARSVDFGDPDAVRGAVEMTHDYLNLALEHLAGGDLRTAIEHLRDTHLQVLFRLGVSLTIDLRKRAEAIVASLGLDARRGREIPYLDSPYRETIDALLQRQPLFFAGLDDATAVTMRGFRAIRDLHLGYAAIDQVDAMRELFKALLGLDIASPGFRANVAGHDIRLSQILLTALLRLRLDHRLLFEPIEAARLSEARAAMMTSGRPAHLNEDFRRAIDGALTRMLDDPMRQRATPYIDSCLKMLEEEFAELDPALAIDPRFMRSFLIRR